MKETSEIIEVIKTATNATETPVETEKKGKAEKKSGKRIGYNYIILKSLKESQKNDVVKCLYIKSLTKFGICVIKEGTYGDSKDREGRDIKDKLIWQKELHEKLQDRVRIPRLMGSFEENGNYYLVLERIKGKSLYKARKEAGNQLRDGLVTGSRQGLLFLDYMIRFTDILHTLHEQQVIHRDVSAANFMIMPSGELAVIDMELSYYLHQQRPSPPFQLGTYGYMSPQQESMQPPAITDDIFSVGPILLQMWTGISPSKITGAQREDLVQKVSFFVPDRAIAGIILKCMDSDPEKRPALEEVRRVIYNYKQDLQLKYSRPVTNPTYYHKEQILATIQNVIGTLASPLLADKEKGWFSEDMNKPDIEEKKGINKAWYTSFNTGATGVIYTLSKAEQTGFDTTPAALYIQKSLDLIERKYINRIEEVSPSLHFGSPGIAACLATAIRENLIEPQASHFSWINQLISVENTWSDYINGIAGQGLAHWHCHPFLDEEQAYQRLSGYVTRLLDKQQKDGSWLNEKTEKKKKVTKGFGRGIAGIIYFLLEYAMQYQDRESLLAAQKGLEWLMKKSVRQKEAICWLNSAKKPTSPWWVHGGPGIALTFLKAYRILGEEKYKKYATDSLRIHPKNVVDNNLSQEEGLAGLGEIYLEAYQILQQEEWLERADWIAQVIMNLKKVHLEHGPYWLIHHERQPVADFMNGNSGVLHYLIRYCHPDLVGFPMLGTETGK